MTQFEFFMTFYGLLLGLSVAELFSGFARIIQDRTPPRVGIILPMLGLIAVIEFIATFIDAWTSLTGVSISFVDLFLPTLIALSYFALAAILVPRQFDEWPDLSAYFDHRRAWIIGLLLTANLLIISTIMMTSVPERIRDEDWSGLTFHIARSAWLIASYVVLLFSRKRWLDIAAAASVIAFYIFNYVVRPLLLGI